MSARQSQWGSAPSRRCGLDAASGLDRLLLPLLAVMLFVRVLTDDLSSSDSRHTGSLNLSGAIAVLFILVALGLLLRRRHGLMPTLLVALWLCVWTAIAVNTSGASTETLREGVREASVVALAAIVYNARGVVTVPVAVRLVQLIGLVPAIVALYQLGTHTGMDIAGHIRSNGTFAQPNSAAMFFVLATVASLWQYLDNGRRPLDVLLATLFAAALIATFSIDGLISLVATLIAFGMLHPGSLRIKLVPSAVASVVVLVFFATPLGAQRIAKESSTSFATAERGGANTTLAWRLHKWKTLLPEWERSPFLGRGLGTTITVEHIPGNEYVGEPPLNEYVRYLVETGVIGLISLLAALMLLIRSLARKRKALRTLGVDPRNMPTLALAVVAGCLVNSLADNTLLNSPTCYAAALIVVAVLAYPSFDIRRAAPQAA
jgi:putative inorganic carbon (hco3(-)) transporter